MRELVPVTRSSMPKLEDYVAEIKDLWESHWLSNRGSKHKQLERELIQLLGVQNLSLFANGHVALEVAIDAYQFKNGGEVITTPYTHCSTTHAIVRNGLIPVFCDIEEDTYVIDSSQIESHITEKTVAIIPTHVYGNICDVEKIEEIAVKYDLKAIYDAAHAFGVTYKGNGIGKYGNASMFSTHATKVFQTIEGGITVFNDPDIYSKIDHMTNFGYITPEDVGYISTNARMNEFEAAMGLCNLKNFNSTIIRRKLVFERYYERLSDIKGIQLLKLQDNVTPNYAYFPIFINGFNKNRNALQVELAKQNIFARKYFYPIIQELKCYQRQYGDSITPIAKRTADSVLSLPIYPDLSLDTVDEICNIILQ